MEKEKSLERGQHLDKLFSRVDISIKNLDKQLEKNKYNKSYIRNLCKHLGNICEILSEDYDFPVEKWRKRFDKIFWEKDSIR